jgi:PQQ enzyme repeat
MFRRFVQASSDLPCSPPPWAMLSAVDMNTGKIKWQVPLGLMHTSAVHTKYSSGVDWMWRADRNRERIGLHWRNIRPIHSRLGCANGKGSFEGASSGQR